MPLSSTDQSNHPASLQGAQRVTFAHGVGLLDVVRTGHRKTASARLIRATPRKSVMSRASCFFRITAIVLCCSCISLLARASVTLNEFGVSGTSVPTNSPATFSTLGQIWDTGLISGPVRTEYAPTEGTISLPLNLVYNQGGAEGCLWNASASFAGCPGRSGLPGTVWSGTLQGRIACGGSNTITGQTWVGCTEYAGGTYFSQSSPGSNFWMVHANDDPSFDQCNEGPPAASHPIVSTSSGGNDIYKIDMTTPTGQVPKLARIQLNLGQKSWFCAQEGAYQFSIPFISVGAQNGRGNPGPVGTINLKGSSNGTIVFSESIPSYTAPSCASGTSTICNSSALGLHLGLYGVASWSGTPRLIFLDLFSEGSTDTSGTGPVESKWNWPIHDSIFFPGAEVIGLTAGTQLATKCGMAIPQIPFDGALHSYKIDFGKLINCVNSLGLFTQAPPTTNFNLDGVHWFIEGIGTAGNAEIDLKNVETAIFISGFE